MDKTQTEPVLKSLEEQSVKLRELSETLSKATNTEVLEQVMDQLEEVVIRLEHVRTTGRREKVVKRV